MTCGLTVQLLHYTVHYCFIFRPSPRCTVYSYLNISYLEISPSAVLCRRHQLLRSYCRLTQGYQHRGCTGADSSPNSSSSFKSYSNPNYSPNPNHKLAPNCNPDFSPKSHQLLAKPTSISCPCLAHISPLSCPHLAHIVPTCHPHVTALVCSYAELLACDVAFLLFPSPFDTSIIPAKGLRQVHYFPLVYYFPLLLSTRVSSCPHSTVLICYRTKYAHPTTQGPDRYSRVTDT